MVPSTTLHWDWTPLPDTALVVRGGRMDGEGLWLNANSVYREIAAVEAQGRWGICVGAAAEATAGHISRLMPYRGEWMRVAELGVLRRSGFELVMVDDPPHGVLLLPGEPTGEDWNGWSRLRSLFTEPLRIPR